MNASQQALLHRLIAFQFDEPQTELTFVERLARENGWSVAYAERVIVEYKKFLFLAVVAGHVASPSEQVDQAWHLHLTYTRSYWEDLCRNVLRQPLHHGPTKGGAVEQAKFVNLYEQTLASYLRHFGHEPPRDIWSPAEQRFGEDLRHVSVNTERHWIIPKPRWPRMLSGQAPLFALGLVSLPLATWNPLDWTGPHFLRCYILLVVVAAFLALMMRLVFAPEETTVKLKNRPPLDEYEVACLAAGPARAVQAAFVAMVQAGTLQVIPEDAKVSGSGLQRTSTVRQGKTLSDNAPRLERALFEAAAVPAENLAPLTAAGLPVAQDIHDSLIKRGLVREASPPARSVIACLMMTAPLLLGLPKIFIGLARGQPVAFLIIACVLTALVALGFLLTNKRLSTTGRATLKSLRAKHARSTQLVTSSAATLPPAELAMAISLFGTGLISMGPLANVHAMLPRPSGNGGNATGGGGCSAGGGGCGGGGCGGGGCGGGGCGGCGGG